MATRYCAGCRGNHPEGSYGQSLNKDDHCWGKRKSCKCHCTYYDRTKFCKGDGCFTLFPGQSGYCDACVETYVRNDADPRIIQYIDTAVARAAEELKDRVDSLSITTRVDW